LSQSWEVTYAVSGGLLGQIDVCTVSAIQSHHRVILWVQGYRPALLSQTSNYLSGQTITFLAQKSWSITHTCPKRGWYNNPSPPEASVA
jgi:hypothetical protein